LRGPVRTGGAAAQTAGIPVVTCVAATARLGGAAYGWMDGDQAAESRL